MSWTPKPKRALTFARLKNFLQEHNALTDLQINNIPGDLCLRRDFFKSSNLNIYGTKTAGTQVFQYTVSEKVSSSSPYQNNQIIIEPDIRYRYKVTLNRGTGVENAGTTITMVTSGGKWTIPTFTPASGYRLDTITYTKCDGTVVTINAVDNVFPDLPSKLTIKCNTTVTVTAKKQYTIKVTTKSGTRYNGHVYNKEVIAIVDSGDSWTSEEFTLDEPGTLIITPSSPKNYTDNGDGTVSISSVTKNYIITSSTQAETTNTYNVNIVTDNHSYYNGQHSYQYTTIPEDDTWISDLSITTDQDWELGTITISPANPKFSFNQGILKIEDIDQDYTITISSIQVGVPTTLQLTTGDCLPIEGVPIPGVNFNILDEYNHNLSTIFNNRVFNENSLSNTGDYFILYVENPYSSVEDLRTGYWQIKVYYKGNIYSFNNQTLPSCSYFGMGYEDKTSYGMRETKRATGEWVPLKGLPLNGNAQIIMSEPYTRLTISNVRVYMNSGTQIANPDINFDQTDIKKLLQRKTDRIIKTYTAQNNEQVEVTLEMLNGQIGIVSFSNIQSMIKVDLYCSQWATYCEYISTIKYIDNSSDSTLGTLSVNLGEYFHLTTSSSSIPIQEQMESLKTDFLENGNIYDWNTLIPSTWNINGQNVPLLSIFADLDCNLAVYYGENSGGGGTPYVPPTPKGEVYVRLLDYYRNNVVGERNIYIYDENAKMSAADLAQAIESRIDAEDIISATVDNIAYDDNIVISNYFNKTIEIICIYRQYICTYYSNFLPIALKDIPRGTDSLAFGNSGAAQLTASVTVNEIYDNGQSYVEKAIQNQNVYTNQICGLTAEFYSSTQNTAMFRVYPAPEIYGKDTNNGCNGDPLDPKFVTFNYIN